MLERFRNSWSMVKASAAVLRQDPELLVFPVLSGVALTVVGASFLGVGMATGMHEVAADGTGAEAVGSVGAFLFYMVTYTVMFFFNAAMVGAALIRLDGGNPTVGDGFRIATERFGAIVGYAVLASTVGMMVRMIRERGGALGRFVAGLFGTAWSLATYLAVPVLVARDVAPLEAVQESAGLFRKTWGEQVAGSISVSLVFLPIFLGIVLLGVLGMALMAKIAAPLAVLAMLSMVGALVLAALVNSALSTIYSAVLYRYATTGEVPGPFDEGVIRNAYRPK